MPLQFAIVTSETCDLAKRFTLDDQGILQSTAIAHMTAGTAKVANVEDVSQLPVVFDMLRPNQAITCGVPTMGDTQLTTRAGVEFRPEAVARTNEAFRYPYDAALYAIDVDVDKRAGSRHFASLADVLDALEDASPWLRYALRFARPSSSSFVDDRGLRGAHIYIGVTRGADIPALSKRMQIEQWAANCGWVKISRSGALLVRQLSDALVYQPSRLMFEAAPLLGPGVTRVVPEEQRAILRTPQVMGRPARAAQNGLIDVSGLPPMRDIETRRFETAVKQAKDARRREAKRIAIDYQVENGLSNGLERADSERYGLMATRALGDHLLPPSWTLAVRDVGRVTVAQILANLPDALGRCCADPFDSWRADLTAQHYGKAEIVMQADQPGVWSHKLQTFFAFTTETGADLATPLERAAEKLRGVIEFPEPRGRFAAGEANTAYALGLLLQDAQIALRYNEATYAVEDGDLPHTLALKNALGRVGCLHVTQAQLDAAIKDVARAHSYDPWRDAVLALPAWDKKLRIDTFFTDLCGAPPSEALTLTGRLLFAGIVMRQLHPGIALHVVPVLTGGQHAGKSVLVAQLAQAFGAPAPAQLRFTDDIAMSMTAAASVVAELCEMAGMAKRDAEEIKRWVTDSNDIYRPPYERKPSAHPRRFVLIGSANKDELNRDETGNRRFMPVFVQHSISPDWAVECKQLLAEAKARFCTSQETYFTLHTATCEAVLAYNGERMRRGEGVPSSAIHELAPRIVQMLARRRPDRRVFVRDVLTHLATDPAGRFIQSSQAVGSWMRSKGWPAGVSCGVTYYTVDSDYLDEGGQ